MVTKQHKEKDNPGGKNSKGIQGTVWAILSSVRRLRIGVQGRKFKIGLKIGSINVQRLRLSGMN